jgi:hypothetical protein
MGNWFATFALLAYPLVVLVLFSNLPTIQAILWTILAAFLLLPVGTAIKFEMFPLLDKNSIASICAGIGCAFVSHRPPATRTRLGLVELLLVMYVCSPLVTSLLNGDPVFAGQRVLPGVGPYDGISAVLSQGILFAPFIIGRRFLLSAGANQQILRVLVVSGLLYSLPLLFEIRFSPQLHFWIYGFYPSDFIQSMRDGGFRPMAFTGHGLLASLFVVTSVIAAAALWRARTAVFTIAPTITTAYLATLLIFCKSSGALVFGFTMGPLVRFARPKVQLRVAVVVVTIALAYPILRTADVFPTHFLVDTAATFSTDRADSLQFRFKNEQILLNRAGERFWFGWGRYGRSRVYNEYGNDLSITDGRWIITMGQFGLFGFLAEFGLLVIPIYRAVRALRFANFRESVLLGALALIDAIIVVDQLPNASLSPWTWLLAGALLGRAEHLLASARRSKEAQFQPMTTRKEIYERA